ncbi:meckelin-like [Babylonia areolata]|uniref:meckelin-like n=1 Tax=Babylonia areolata TaxID=304850 RepID=UPI003FD50CE8
MAVRGLLLVCFSLSLVFGQQVLPQDNYVLYITKDSCGIPQDGVARYFDSVTMACKKCDQNITFQKTSTDGLSCVCQPRYRYTRNFGGDKVTCAPCPANQFVSTDGWECKRCAAGSTETADTCTCEADRTITAERQLNGLWINQSPQRDSCVLCEGNTVPNSQGDRCVRCSDDLKVGLGATTCPADCKQQTGGYCFPDQVELLQSTAILFEIPRVDGTDNTISQYFERHLRAAYALCNNDNYQNATACQLVANLCVLTLYNERQGRICSFIRQEDLQLPGRSVPYQILYFWDRPEDVITSTDIPDSYTLTPPMAIPFRAMVYSLEGEFLRSAPLTDGLLQLCDSTETTANAAYIFGTYYKYSCRIKALRLWDSVKYPLEFFDIYLNYTDAGQQRLFKIPLVFSDLRDNSDNTINTGAMNDWRITRRMFLVDNQMNIPSSTGSGGAASEVATYVRYAKEITLHITLQDDTKDGKIKIPYFSIKYADVSREDADAEANVEVSFSTTYTMSWSSYRRDFQIAVGTLGTLATLYAGFRTWVWSKRAGRPSIDFPTIINFIFFTASSLSNIFFVITFGIAFYWFIVFKRQDVVYLVHPEGQAVEEWLGLLGAAFALRCLSLLHLLVMQCSADVFLVDWERPRGVSSAQDGKKTSAAPVSIWRTYFVANEWNELQGQRKISPVLQIFTVCFFLVVVGFDKTTTKDPDGSVEKTSEDYQAEQSIIYRYALAVLVYIIVAVVQWVFFTFIYERFVEDKVQQFVDLCSMSNVSVFVMAHAQFGYYIHGRSVHGKADTNMKEMAEMMKREEEDLCGKRGLLPDTEEQTFIMSLPKRLRVKYEQVYLPAALENAGAVGRMEQGKAGGRIAGTAMEKSIEAYNMLNRFLCAFLDHSLRDVDYVVKDKTLLESIMDTEFFDATDKGIFYKDNGHSFDQVLFYGNEMSLMLFDILLFCMVDLIWQNYVLDGVIVFLITSLVTIIRDTAGRKNLARKTLVDERFLI